MNRKARNIYSGKTENQCAQKTKLMVGETDDNNDE